MSQAPSWFDANGLLVRNIPNEAVKACSRRGKADGEVKYWQRGLQFNVPRHKATTWLAAFGAWPVETNEYDIGLVDMSTAELSQLVLWIACSEIKENGSWIGLMH